MVTDPKAKEKHRAEMELWPPQFPQLGHYRFSHKFAPRLCLKYNGVTFLEANNSNGHA
jgi:hypothetical protein